jgi:hypothetical protein
MPSTLRPFDWRDLPLLRRYRHQSVCLNSAQAVTRGAALSAADFLASITPAPEVFGRFTWVCSTETDGPPLVGQFTHVPEETVARISFLAPESALDSPSLPALLEGLARSAGARGAFNLLAETDEESVVFAPLRQAGFSIYARQQIWELPPDGETPDPRYRWSAAGAEDDFAIQTLYQSIVPGLVQQIEPPSERHAKTLVCYREGEPIAYADLKQGPRGVWVQPFVHPDVEDTRALLRGLLSWLPHRRERTVYFCVRTYQSWLESALNGLEARPGPRQAVMVKRLTAGQRSLKAFSLPKLEAQGEITTPISQMENASDKVTK